MSERDKIERISKQVSEQETGWHKYRSNSADAMTAVSIFGKRTIIKQIEYLQTVNPTFIFRAVDGDTYSFIQYRTK